MAPLLSTHSPTTKWGWQRNWIHRGAPRPANPVTCFPPGKVVAPATKGGDAFPTPAGRLYGFSRQRRHKKWRRRRRTSTAGTVSQPIGKPFNGQAKGLLWLTWRSYAGPPQYYITPEGGSPQSVREASAGPGQNPGNPGPKGPAAGSTLTPVRACQPTGIPESTAPVPTAPKGA